MNMQHIHHAGEDASNRLRDDIVQREPCALRTYTPTQAVLSHSSGVFHWTADGRRLYDFTSGVLVANLGHNPVEWFNRFVNYMKWPSPVPSAPPLLPPFARGGQGGYFDAITMSAYNAITPVEADACRRLVGLMQSRPGGSRMEQVLWAASGSEAVQKALWAALARDRSRNIIIATRYGFHGKKGLATAVTGSEDDPDRDPRIRFISFPMEECRDVSLRDRRFDALPYVAELDALKRQFGKRLAALITEPYLGGAGSYHPPKDYLRLLQSFCRENDIIFILDEIQANFGRTGDIFAFETYGLEPDIVVLGKGLANGVPGAAAVGRADVFGSLDYGEGSDTYSANPLACAGVLATIDLFESGEVLANVRRVSPIIEAGLLRLKELPFVRNVRGERNGMVWGVEIADAETANACILACYRGEGEVGIHLLGPLAKKVIRIAPPLVITEGQAIEAMNLMYRTLRSVKPDNWTA